jgi:phage terminase Nu1 subunit (DNA packaging protein)
MQQSQKPNFEETHDVKYEEGTEYHVDQLNEEIRSLKQTNERLKEAVKTAVAQRDHWKQRALVVERELATSGNAERDRDKRLDALRRLIAKELHPDQCAAQGIERVLRAELFKLIWPKVEELSRQGRGGDQP